MSTPITQRFIQIAYDRLDDLPAGVGVNLVDSHITGFADLPNMVEINHIEVPEGLQGQGYGSQALTILTQIADDLGVTLVLTVAQAADPDDEEDWPMSFEELSNWYERYGFEGDRKMVRDPRA